MFKVIKSVVFVQILNMLPATGSKKVGIGRGRGMSTDVLLYFPPTNHSIESRTLQSVFPPSGVKIGPIFLTES